MQVRQLLTFLFAIGLCNTAGAQSTGHIGHTGGPGQPVCFKAKISHYKPEHLATVPPGAEFSFIVSGSAGPGHIHAFVRDQPIKLAVEDKEMFYVVKGSLPDNFKNEMVRLNIQVKGKFNKCDADGGLLLKVTE